jgi:CHAT domain-containing protein/Tfp pilus assembly protein PilF
MPAEPDLQEQVGQLNRRVAAVAARGRYQELLSVAPELCELARRALGENHPEYAASLHNLAELYRAAGDAARAEPLYRQASDVWRRTRGENHPDYANSLTGLALTYKAAGDYGRAEPLLRQAHDILRQARGEDHADYAAALNNLAGLYQATGEPARAEPLLRQASDIWRRALGEDHPDYATSLHGLAGFYKAAGDCARAEPLYRQASDIWRRTLGENHAHYATSLSSLAGLYEARGDYVRAEPLYRQASDIWRQAVGENHPEYATSLNNLAGLSRAVGDFARAESLWGQALDIRRRALGEEHPDYAAGLNNLAALYHFTGDYARAEPLHRQALDIRRRALGEGHPDYAQSLNNLAGFYHSAGDYERAALLYRQALDILRRARGENHPDYATGLNNLAELYRATGDYARAEPLCRQASDLLRQVVGENHPNYTTSLNNLAMLYCATGDYARAGPLLRQALEIGRRARGENHPLYAFGLNGLAFWHKAMGDYAGAEPLFRQASDLWRQALGDNHPDAANSLTNLAELSVARGDPHQALDRLRQALAIDERALGQIFTIASDRQRLAYLRMIQVRLDLLLSLVCRHLADCRPALQSALEVLLRRKSLAAEALLAQRDAILGGRYPHLQEPLRQLTLLRRQIAHKTLAGPAAGEEPAAHQRQLAAWHAQRERQEQELARQVPEMNLEQQLRAAGRRTVALALPEGAALVEFVRFNVWDFHAVPARGERQWQPARYLAVVLPAGEPDHVQMLDLGEAEAIDQLVAAFRAAITRDPGERRRDQVPYTEEPEEAAATAASFPPDRGAALRQAVFDALLPHLGGRTRLLLCPDGDLTRLPFEVLPDGRGGRLIDTYQISYLSSGRDVLRFGARATGHPSPPLVAADPDFDLASRPAAVVSTPPAPKQGGLFSWLLGGRHSRELDRAAGACRLPGTRAEGERIAALLGVKPWLEAEVLEARLKEARSPRLLHLATHGFFLKDQPHELESERWEDPLLRSGLLLAGYNTWLARGQLPEEAEDGMLTAEDVTGLDLLGTELVVLSACETGLGQVHVGEGVFGLRRAFVLAGAKTLVMSLWKVPDQQTQQLMVDFYQRILAGQPRGEALRQAQLALKARHPDPYYWGAFICQGDPAPLV